MSQFRQLSVRFRALFLRRQWEDDMAEEMRLHLQQRTEENIAAGMTPDEAHYAARRQFGGIEQIKELAREQRGLVWVENLGQDLRYGVRMLRRQPGFTAVAVLTLALGIGATTAIFSAVNGMLLRPLAYPEADRLVLVEQTLLPKYAQALVTPGAFLAWQKQATVFANLAAWTYGPYNLTGVGEPRRLYSQRVTSDFFGTMGVSPELGRDFRAGEDNVVILSHGIWLEQFGGRASVIGQTIQLDQRPFVVIGVTPESFQFDRRADIYTPVVYAAQGRGNFTEHNLLVVGRLNSGVTLPQARDELSVVADRLARLFPATNEGWGATLLPLLNATVGSVRPLLLTLLGAVGCLLLIACVNVANLLLSRASTRQREIAVRVALGAGRERIVRQLLCESLFIAALGGVLGVFLAYGGVYLLLAFVPDGLPRVQEISMDGRVLAFTCALAVCTGIGFGLVPALEATGVDPVNTLKDGGHGATDGRRRLRLRSVLVVLEVGLALILLTGAGLLARSFIRLEQVDPGFQTHNVYMNNIVLALQKYPSDAERVAVVDRMIENIAKLPNIQAVSFTNHTLPSMGNGLSFFTIAGRKVDSQQQPVAHYYAVTPDYFQALGIPLLRGRGFGPRDVAGAPRVALINQEMARLNFPHTDPLGQRISLGSGPDVWREIIGIVGDVKQNGRNQPTRAQIYDPFAQNPSASTTLVVQTALSATDLAAAVGTAVHAIDKDIPFTTIYPIAGELERDELVLRFTLLLFSVFAVIALFLAGIGVYGVMSHLVNQRRVEIGIRMALGAQRRDVLWLIFRQGGSMVGAGLLGGLAGAFIASRLLGGMLFKVSPHDPLTLAAIMALLATVAFFACWLPALRATRVDPLVALRCE